MNFFFILIIKKVFIKVKINNKKLGQQIRKKICIAYCKKLKILKFFYKLDNILKFTNSYEILKIRYIYFRIVNN